MRLLAPTPTTPPDLVEVSNFGGPPALLFYALGAILLLGVVAIAVARRRQRG